MLGLLLLVGPGVVSELEDNLAWQMSISGLPAAMREFRFAPPRRWRFDFAFSTAKLAVEVDGGTWVQGRHSRGEGFEKDCEKVNEAAARGWRIVRVTAAMISDGRALQAIEEALKC